MSILARLSAAIVLVSSISAASAAEGWSSNFEASRKTAAAEGKDLLIDFTGSDWCSWCIQLRKEVFVKEEFAAAAPKKFVLVELDYPKDKSILSEEVATQNAKLLEQYPIKGYPTILLCDASGKPFAATGYRPGGPATYLPHLDELLENKTNRDKAFADAETKQGVEKARALIAALDGMGLDSNMIRANYGDIGEAIVAADPSDETGFKKKQATEERFARFMHELGELSSKNDPAAVAKMVESTLEDPLIEGEYRQQVQGHYAGSLAYAGKKDKAIEVLKKAVAEDKGPRTKELQDFIGILEKEMAKPAPAKD